MVKILFFIEHLGGGGAEKVLCNLVNELDRSKFDVTVQTLWKCDAEQFLKPWIRYRWCYALNHGLDQYRSRLEVAAGLTYRLRIRDSYDLEAAFLECGATKIMAASTNRHAKKVAWVHCDLTKKMEDMADPEGFVRKSTRWYQKYDRVVCVSQNVKDSFVRLFGREEDTSVIYNTVDDVFIRENSELMPQDLPSKRRLTVAAAGRLSAEKQYDLLLRVHKRLLENGLAHDLWIIGEGDERSRLEAFVEENRLSDSVRLFGYRENPYPYMKTADILVCSSRYEGLSTFVTEGLILGKPIVTTECSGMRELLGDSEYGLITDNSEKALLEGMRSLLSDAALRKRYAARAAEHGCDFSARRLTKKTEQFFLNLLED